MPSRRTAPKALSDIDIRQLAADLAAGRSPTVWFTSAAVGIEEGRSGTLVAIADPAEPDHLRVRPSRCTDVLAFSPSELTRTRPRRSGAHR
ncbi:hypothetical protein [Nocardia blacklockiae]|uniref:hypothetical protein n=1 Tax=Nocardia blacklockiae TaxID=480036 RepID=UPI001892F132|nr:hypothetical protein [Nocardia blacklockiae]MBF6169899.1 hypothetical protein [Nocardia blacklockiae]